MIAHQFIFLPFIALFFFAQIYAQGNAGDNAPLESRFIVDMPTAGVLPKSAIGVYVNSYPGGGMMADVSYGISSWLNLGSSFGINNLIGSGDIVTQDYPSLNIRARIFNETLVVPAIMIGLNTQGRGGFLGNRFQTQPPGLFAVASKTYRWPLGSISAHAGLCYSLSPDHPSKQIPNFYLGVEHSLGPFLSVAAEYNPTLDERFPSEIYLKSGGILNIAFRCSIASGITAELQLRDILKNLTNMQGISRTLGIEIVRNL